jgi:predicted HD phosphohydrolase
MAAVTCEGLFERLETRGGGLYGLSLVTQLEHALQSAALARTQGLGDAMTIAALFHDVGHLRTAADVDLAARGIDDRHEVASARLLDAVFGPEVSEPVRLHVLAKRYLVTVEPAYGERLSDDSRLSLTLQGGPLSEAEVAAFAAEPFFADAVRLRRIDDNAKVTGLDVPPLETYRAIALALARDGFTKFQ